MAFFIPPIQFFFGLPHALFCFGIHFNDILGSISSAMFKIHPVKFYKPLSSTVQLKVDSLIQAAEGNTHTLGRVEWALSNDIKMIVIAGLQPSLCNQYL